MKAGFVLAFVAVACAPEETVLRLAALDPAECRAHCISAVTVSLDDVVSEHPCGVPIERGPLIEGETHQLVVTATGAYGLNVAAEIRAERIVGELSLKLEPRVLPQIDRLRISSERQAIYGTTRVVIEANNFIPGHPTTRVLVNGADLPILSQSEGQLEVETDQNGIFALEQCGVASPSQAFAAKAVRQRTLNFEIPGCVSPRYLSASHYPNDAGRTLLAYGCGAQCNRTVLVQLSTAARTLEEVAEVDGCPIDVAASREDLIWVSTETGLHVCTGAAPLSCTLRAIEGRYQRLTRVDDERVAGIYLADGQTETSLRFENHFAGGNDVAPNRVRGVAAVDGPMALSDTEDFGSLLFQWSLEDLSHPFALQANLQECRSPRLLHRYANQNQNPNFLVVCGEADDLQILRFGLDTRTNGSLYLAGIAKFSIVAPLPYDLAVDSTGRMAWLWSPSQLTFVDLGDRAILGTLPIPPGAAVPKVARTDGGDHWYLGGPNPGELLSWALE